VQFRITLHSGFAARADALELLSQALGASRGGARFAKVGAEITATWGEDAPVAMERDVREEIGRRTVLDVVVDVCELTPGLSEDWFAVSPSR
jgi:hypothetical protein